MPKVSIITPVYNRPQYLEEAVNSIQRQSYTDWEHIIVDDGSTNVLTEEVLKKVSALPKIAFYRTENRGLGAARNFAIEKSAGEFILTLDDDDKWHPEFIAAALNIFNNKPQAAGVTAWMKEFGLTNRVIKIKGGGIKNFLIENNSVHGMFKKEYWETCGKYDENKFIQPYTDWDLWLRMTAMGYNIEVIEQPFFFYRIHHQSSVLKEAQGRHLTLFRYMVEKNKDIYQKYMIDTLCLLEEKTINMQKELDSGGLAGKLKRMLSI
jgi:GT2 family glycosyltransferase